MKEQIKNLIEVVKTGRPEEVKIAQKKIEKIWRSYSFKEEDRKKRKLDFNIFLEELENFDKICDDNHKAYFIYTTKLVVWFDSKGDFEKWAKFFIKEIQNPSGKVRQAVVRTANYLISSLKTDFNSFHLNNKLSKEDKERIVAHDISLYGHFVLEVQDLLDRYYEPKFNRYKYISSLPIGIYKSLNLLMVEIMPTDYFKRIYDNFLNELKAKRKGFNNYKEMKEAHIFFSDLLKEREEIIKDLKKLIDETSANITTDEIIEIIYEEKGSDSIHDILLLFSNNNDFSMSKMNEILALINKAWNYFPHRSLGGISPLEKASDN